MAKNNNLVTVSKLIPTKSSHVVIGSSVAPGLTRYVTMVKAMATSKTNGKGSRVFFCSGAASGTGTNQTTASAIQKIKLTIASTPMTSGGVTQTVKKTIQVPQMPDSANPLFSIAESKWFTATLSSETGASAPVNIFAQYYDE